MTEHVSYLKAAERFWPKVDKHGSPYFGLGPCWLWTGALHRNGYGAFLGPEKRNVRAHRFAYELLVGPIPEGLDLDHLCRVRACVNPRHLEPVTRRENLLRGATVTAAHAVATHCVHGHEFDHENTLLLRNGRRQCRACNRRRARESYARKRGAA